MDKAIVKFVATVNCKTRRRKKVFGFSRGAWDIKDLEISISSDRTGFPAAERQYGFGYRKQIKRDNLPLRGWILPAEGFLKKPSPFRRWEKQTHFPMKNVRQMRFKIIHLV